MATEVLHAFNDFVLFPHRDDVYGNLQESFPGSSLGQLRYPTTPNFPQDFPTMPSYYGSEPAVSSTDFSLYEPSTGSMSTSGAQSTSPSVSQSNDQTSSNFSHTSGASAQSTASSAVGSPYSQPNHSTPTGQDQWIEAGLGIAGGLAPAEFFPSAPYHMPTSEPDSVTFDERYAGSYVGELSRFPWCYTITTSSLLPLSLHLPLRIRVFCNGSLYSPTLKRISCDPKQPSPGLR